MHSHVFYGCKGLTSVTLSISLWGIPDFTFSGCTSLTSITIPNSVTYIGDFAFQNCTGLTSVTIPSNVSNIGINPFSGCTGLSSIIVAPTNVSFNSSDNCNAIIRTNDSTLIAGCQNTVIPHHVKRIGRNAFFHFTGLTSISIPNWVIGIGESAFEGCTALTSVVLGNCMSGIDKQAFYKCSSLSSIISLNQTPPSLATRAFDSYTATVKVPVGSKSSYADAYVWRNFTNIVEIDPTGIRDIHQEDQLDTLVYDLNGRRFSTPHNGIFIKNGKKYFLNKK